MTAPEWIAIGLLTILLSPLLLYALAFMGVRPIKLFLAGYHPWSRCWMGLHRWSMPGGWCERCGMCDKFFGGHSECGKTCRHWEGSR